MDYLKKLGISLGYGVGIVLISLFLFTVLNYFNIIGVKTMSFFKIATLLISLFIIGYVGGKRSKQKGWLEGLKMGLIIIVLMLLIGLIFFSLKMTIKLVIFYIIILAITTFGSMVGINKRIENN